MANETMTLISTVTVGSGGAASLDFASIPQTFTDLLFVYSTRMSGAGSDGNPWTGGSIQFNGTSTITAAKLLFGTGSTTGSSADGSSLFSADTNATSNTFASGSVYIPNYTGSALKGYASDNVIENNATLTLMALQNVLTSQTAAITSLSFAPLSSTYGQYSTASLYGILKGSGGATVS